jgi:hypothetical protein
MSLSKNDLLLSFSVVIGLAVFSNAEEKAKMETAPNFSESELRARREIT